MGEMQVLYSVRSERMLMEPMRYTLSFRGRDLTSLRSPGARYARVNRISGVRWKLCARTGESFS
jgi:hypothetical protein